MSQESQQFDTELRNSYLEKRRMKEEDD